MRSIVTAAAEAAVPISVAYDQWTQFELFPLFMSSVDSVEQIDDTHTHWSVSIGGVTREFDAAVTEQVADDHITWSSTDGETHAGSVRFERRGPDVTHIDVSLAWSPHSFIEHVGAALALDDRAAQADLERFTRLVEDEGHVMGAWRGDAGRRPSRPEPPEAPRDVRD